MSSVQPPLLPSCSTGEQHVSSSQALSNKRARLHNFSPEACSVESAMSNHCRASTTATLLPNSRNSISPDANLSSRPLTALAPSMPALELLLVLQAASTMLRPSPRRPSNSHTNATATSPSSVQANSTTSPLTTLVAQATSPSNSSASMPKTST